MLRAQRAIETDLEASVDKAIGTYYKAERSDILAAARSQPPGVDIRDRIEFMTRRFNDLENLNYVPKNSNFEGLLDFSYLENVIRNNPDLHQSLRFKAEAGDEGVANDGAEG